ncbi:MAG: TOBE domain-containing protein [Sedimentitalea sp.]|uniref:TOBE domain-containing protein n=1 Tax=Sedimentitalea sp. TaxID=2048915 RepID=UPI0032648EAE
MASLQGRHKVAIRPEYLRLKRALEDSSGSIGTVNFVRLLGASIETELTVEDGTIVHTMVSDRAPEFEVGERAEISFDLDRVWVIPS